MNRIMLTAVLVAPLFIVGGLYVYASDAARERAASRLRSSMTPSAESQPAAANPNMVHPETLPQGFILVVKDSTGLASSTSPIYLASSHNGWDPGDKTQILTSRSDMRWQIVLPKPKTDAPLAFKFTRGNWDLEELSDKLEPINNRELPLVDKTKYANGEKPIFEFVVAHWGDQKPNSGLRPDLNPYFDLEGVTGNVKRLQVTGGGIPVTRDVFVWLPPGYDDPKNADRTYPVLYMHDGQNLFTKMPSIPAKWAVDETATKLIEAGKVEPLIIVGIPHAGGARMSEYAPFQVRDGVPPTGKAYVEFIVDEVMPRVERTFRVKTDKANTGIGGSSLGAIISLYAVELYPEKFGKVLLESMARLGEGRPSLEFFKNDKNWPPKIYFAMGKQETGLDPKDAAVNASYVQGAEEFIALIKSQKGVVSMAVIEDGTHNEVAWAKRFPAALEFLYPASGKSN